MEIIYEEKKIEFQIKYTKRKSIQISVKPTLQVEVVAPKGINDEKIKDIVLKKAPWILKNLHYFKKHSHKITRKHFTNGEIHRYLGEEYILKVISHYKNNVNINEKYICIYTLHEHDMEYNKKLLYKWYKENSKKVFENLFNECYKYIKPYGIEKPSFNIRKMRARWGSYNPRKNHILLSTELAKFSYYEIQYVIIHEMCHAKYPNHNKKFYEFMDIVMPDWKERKKKLNMQ